MAIFNSPKVHGRDKVGDKELNMVGHLLTKE
jgi:hypothetical protein